MAATQRIIPEYINADIDPTLVTGDVCRYIKNLIYSLDDSSAATANKGASTGTFKPIPSTAEYIENLVLPLGDNQVIGSPSFSETKEIFVFVHNSLGNHTIYRLNGKDQTYDIVSQGSIWNFQLSPEYFIHQAASTLNVIYVSDPITGEKLRRSFLQFTDGFNPQRFLCVEDSIATKGFDQGLFPYFSGNYDRNYLISMGVPTPSDCIEIKEQPIDDNTKSNQLIYETWQYRLLYTDVWGRPSEHGIISELYIPGGGNCFNSPSNIARCLDLIFDAPPPHINSIQIEYRRCNSQQWYRTETINLYNGSQFGAWWLRERNEKVNYNGQTGKITYAFCADKECDPIPPAETNRLYNPLARNSQAVTSIGKFTALSNNKERFAPFSQDLLDKITVEAVAPDNEQAQNNSVNLDVWVEIYNPGLFRNQPIFLDEGANPKYVFGAFNTSIRYRSTFAYFQFFPNSTQKGFVGYLAGTDVFTISKQYFLSNTGVLTKIDEYTITSLQQYYNGDQPKGTFLQKFEFRNIPKGHYVFRIASHQSDPTTNDEYQKTSTYFKGLFPFNSSNFALPVIHTSMVSNARELKIDACEGSFDGFNSNQIPVIFDLNCSSMDVEQWYIKNTNVPGETQYGVELLEVSGGRPEFGVQQTDYNGFFFVATNFAQFAPINVSGYCGCNKIWLFSWQITTGGDDINGGNNIKYLNQSTTCTNYETQVCNYILIKGKVRLCNSDIGIQGITVLLTRGQSTKTDENGEFTIIAHDDSTASNRTDDLYFITGSCIIKDCNEECITPISVTINKCISGCNEREIEVEDTLISYSFEKGLLSGGSYSVGITPWDWIDRPGFIQSIDTVTMPSLIETKSFSPSSLILKIPPDAVFPPEVKYLTVSLTEETTIADFVTWIVDSFLLIDNTGNENTIAPTQIKIFYSSLIEYNKQNDYNTTVNWDFIDEETNVPVTADKVVFYLNGDGTFFDKTITSIIKYNQEGQYFLINYTEDLKNLQQNAIIRLIRPKVCIGTEPYFELCHKIPVVNQHATINELVLNAFDTYYISRQIPVPTLVPDTDPPQFINEPRIFGTPFEHNSPSDFWGKGCKNIGRVNTKNPYEAVLYKQDEVALSGALSDNGQLNYLNYFDDDKKKTFNENGLNGITGVIAQPGVVLIVGQNDWITVGFNDNLLRVNADGSVKAGSIDDTFGKPNVKNGMNYGCNLFDKNTLYFYKGLTHWQDSNTLDIIQNDFNTAIPISQNGIQGYVRSKINAVKKYNLENGNKRYFFGCVNPLAKEYLWADRIIGSSVIINNEWGYNIDLPETNRFGIIDKRYRGQYSFCPEYFSELEADINDVQLFSFVKGKANYHYSTFKNKGVGIIYGQKVNRAIRIVVAIDPLRKKKSLALGIVCSESMYFSPEVLTENQRSRILKSQFRKADYGFYAPFLCNLSSKDNSLMDSDMLMGNYIDILLIGDPDKDTIESRLQGFLVNVFGESNNFKTSNDGQ